MEPLLELWDVRLFQRRSLQSYYTFRVCFLNLFLPFFLFVFFFLNNDTANIIEKIKYLVLSGASHWTVAIVTPGRQGSDGTRLSPQEALRAAPPSIFVYSCSPWPPPPSQSTHISAPLTATPQGAPPTPPPTIDARNPHVSRKLASFSRHGDYGLKYVPVELEFESFILEFCLNWILALKNWIWIA